MNVSLTPELERRVAEKVASGLYTSASEVVREGLRLLFEADEIKARRLEQMNADIQLGLDQLERGKGIDGEESRRRVRARFAAKP
jgi:antitoxin ParD1/3/4